MQELAVHLSCPRHICHNYSRAVTRQSTVTFNQEFKVDVTSVSTEISLLYLADLSLHNWLSSAKFRADRLYGLCTF